MESNQANEITLYQPDDTLTLDVRVEDESVWLTQAQMAELFLATKQNVSLHIRNIFKEGELDEKATVKEYLTVQKEGKRDVQRKISYYNLDVIISVGYRVRSLRGTQFRQWANKVLKEYLLRGYSINQRLMQLEDRVDRRLFEHDRHLLQLDEKVDFFVRSSLQPKEGVFFNRQISKQLRLDVEKHNEQYPDVTLHKYTKAHDRFLIIDEEVYHIGASLKDLGKKLFAFSKMEVMTGSELLDKL